jgi:galactokinase/mevalonate kinase-like predicted kinase
MHTGGKALQYLLSLPPRMAAVFGDLEGRRAPDWFAGHDPEGRPLGSGGGTAHVLVEAWRATGEGRGFLEWLRSSRKLVLHAGGQSRRLPAYAATGKILMPIPVFRWARGQRLDQTLLDVQLPDYERVLRQAPPGYVALVASGDVLLRFDTELPEYPVADVLGLGMRTTPEVARDFGVYFTPRGEPEQWSFFLQKPSAERVRELAGDHAFLVDTGMWLLSEAAVLLLLRRSGWDEAAGGYRDGVPVPHELYAGLGLGLGTKPTVSDPDLAGLRAAVMPLPRPEFLHFGTSRQMIESLSMLQNREGEVSLPAGGWGHPDQHVQNARLGLTPHRERNRTLWIENAVVPADWQLESEHVLTGIPDNRWGLSLARGVCLEGVPVEGGGWVLRAYGIDDAFSGALGDPRTLWMGRPFVEWLREHGLTWETSGLDPAMDIQRAPLFPEVSLDREDGEWLGWWLAAHPVADAGRVERWRRSTRQSAADLPRRAALARVYGQRNGLRSEALGLLMEHRAWSVFHRLDLDRTAKAFAGTERELSSEPLAGDTLHRVHEAMFRAAVRRHRGEAAWAVEEDRAFGILRDLLLREAQGSPVRPKAAVVEDQIVWARSPVRFDLAGGWTDTPPYCLEHGGRVVNVAVDLNGQPPMQVFVRLSARPELVLRSIDLGCEERVTTFEELARYEAPGGAFALVKAACALAGFLPAYHADGGGASLRQLLEAFGGGLELSLLSAVPKGSGLGTSSILAATVLAALSEVGGLHWDRATLFSRTLALEQMMGTGGGWQDQAGGLYPSVKRVETRPGLAQVPRVRWLPERLLGPDHANRRMLLYYTGMTRMAKGILGEIVRGIFLNSPGHLGTLERIGTSAEVMALALEQCDEDAFAEAVRETWTLKQQLDRGTNPPPVQALLAAVESELVAATLPGAGGGGYLLMIARDMDAAQRVRRRLTEFPPNPRARFVDFAVSPTGLQVTRS